MQSLPQLGLEALAILDESPAVTYVTRLEPEPAIVFASRAVRAMLGYSPEQFIDQPGFLTSLVHPDDADSVDTSIRNALAYGSAVCDRRLRVASGEWRWLRDNFRIVRDAQGKVLYGVGTITDVTEEKTAHEALAARTAEYRVLAEHSSDLISRVTVDGRFLYQSPSVRRLMGFDPEERRGTQSFAQIHPDDILSLGAAWKACLKTRAPRMLRYRAFHADGRWVTFEAAVNPVVDPETGKVTEFVIVSRDISERIEEERQLEKEREEIRERSEIYGLFSRHASDFFMRLAVDGRMTHVSPSHERMLGRQVLLREGRLADVVYPDDLESTRAVWLEAITQRTSGTFRCRVRHEHGHLVWIEAHLTPVSASGEDGVSEMIAVCRDVTAQVEAEEALAKAHALIAEQGELYDLFASRGTDIFLRFTASGRVLHVSPSHERILGNQTLVKDNRVMHLVHPDDRHIATDAFVAAHETQKPVTYRHRYAHIDGSWVWLEVNLTPLISESGQVTEYIAVARDVGAQIEAERAAAAAAVEAEDRARQLKAITDSSSDIFMRHRADGVQLFVSSAYSRVLGHSMETIESLPPWHHVHRKDGEGLQAAYKRLIETRETQEHRFRAHHADGHWVWLEARISPVIDPQTGELLEAISVCRDISSRIADEERLNRAQRELSSTARRLKFLSDNSADAIITADARGTIRSASGGVELIYGCSADELVGSGLDLVHEEDRPIAEAAVREFAETRAPVSYRIRQVKRGEGYIWAAHRANPVFDDAGTLLAAVITVRNVDADVEREVELLSARRDLENSRRTLQLVSDNMADIITIVRPDGLIEYMSPSVKQVLGYTPEAMMSPDWVSVVHPDDQPMTDAEVAQNRKGIVAPELTYRVRRADGTYVWIERRARAIEHHSFGEGVAILSIIRDVSAVVERQRQIVDADKALKESNDRLRLVTDNVADVISLFKPDGSVAYMSPSAVNVIGYTPEEIALLAPGEIMHPEDRQMVLDEVAQNRLGRIAPVLRYRVFHKDGRLVWLERRASPLHDHDFGPGVAVLSVISDITERVRQEFEIQTAWAALEESRQRLQTIMDNSIDVIAVFGADRRMEYLSKSAEQQSGYTVEEFFDGSAVLAHPDDEALVKDAVERERAGGEGETFRYRGVRKDGRIIWLERRARKVFDAATGELRYVVTVTRDISDQVKHEQEITAANTALERAKLAAEAASVAKSQFLATMSHELRTPMTGVMGMLDLMKGTGLTGEQGRYASLAYESADNLLSILNDILDFSKIEAGQMQIASEPFSLRAEVGKVTGLLTPVAAKKGNSLEFLADESVADALMGDGPRIRQVLFNLVGNAVKFTSDGRIAIAAKAVGDGAGRRLRLEVQDSGVGIPESAQKGLFRPFVQADGSASRKAGGTGLGLAISRSFVEAMGGTIGFESIEGKGSTFWFELPLVEAAPAPAAVPGPAPIGQRARRRFDILVAEDHPVNQQLIAALLKRDGHVVTMVGNGQLAVEAVQRRAFDLVLMDVQMPVMDGTAATRAIRALPTPAAQTPIVAITANALRGDMESYLAAGMNGYVSKPIRIDALRDAMEVAVPWNDETARLAG